MVLRFKLFKIIILAFLVYNYSGIILAQQKLHIVTSSTPIAAIVKAIVQDLAEVESLEFGQNSCSHGYQFKPSDIYKIQSADLIIYIDDRFEHYMTKLSTFCQSQVIKLSGIEGISLINNGIRNNWHIWYDIDNIKLISLELYKILTNKLDHYLKQDLFKSYQEFIVQLNVIQEKKNDLFKNFFRDIIVLDSAIEYFFNCNKAKVIKVPINCHRGIILSTIQKIRSLSKKKSLCVILGQQENIKNLNALFNDKIKVIRLDREAWNKNIDSKLLLSNLNTVIVQLHDCL
ncbi:periplasmic solute binding family protein [Orientia chuto str. Dubai]|uniref:Periplasmic solute binding family protein n=1 Tax=Orientia chuto str. Dubai TaxID=1359168 RepID=A0A0F3MLY7_9RICK|nr:zinc ABC transporter substrate-binding protein [Candidatus Orientia mediorientalis]KJV56750.1 periplasmic solute binding family protein [Orientia chuto str. Dubai]